MSDAALVGPNAVTRLAEALRAQGGETVTQGLFRSIGRSAWLAAPPTSMLPAAEVARLHRAVRDTLGPTSAAAVLADAGRRTATYLLAQRIPTPARWLLARLPRWLATRVLLTMLRRNAWTFGAKGRFGATGGSRPALIIVGNPLCAPAPGQPGDAPVCAWHEAVFETLFQAVVSPAAHVHEISCIAQGDAECRFEVTFDAR